MNKYSCRNISKFWGEIMERKTKIVILIGILLVVMGVATHLFLTPSTIENSGSKKCN